MTRIGPPVLALQAEDSTTTLDLIRSYHKLGWTLTRTAPGSKVPIDLGWQSAPAPTEGQLRGWFETGDSNPGLRLGQVSGNVHDLDCDDERLIPFLAAAAPAWALNCPRWARGARPHVLVKTAERLKYAKFTYGGKCILEVRGDGHQSLIPPAVHPGGDPYVWIAGPHQPPVVSAQDVTEWAEDAVVAFALSTAWVVGSRHDLALAAAGWMARRGVTIARARRLIEAVAQQCGDRESIDRSAAVEGTYQCVARGEPATGFPTLQRLISPETGALLRQAWPRNGDGDDEEGVGIYRARAGRVFAVRRAPDGEETTVELANFDVRVLREVSRDDGSGEIQRVLELGGTRASGRPLPSARIAADEFSSLSWVIREFGAEAVVSAGQGTRDRLREAIQRLSGKPMAATVYSHTGFREINGAQVFLHAGLQDEVRVELDGGLARYSLPPVPEDPLPAIVASINFLRVGDLCVTAPLWAAMFLAPLSSILHPDLTVWLWGPTGAFKSTLAALSLCHFGDFTRTTLPADWSSTDNALERMAFLAKDVPLVIDEFAPPPGRYEQQRLVAKASRLLRAQGNLAGRGRMRADTSLRSANPPRGVILVTAEAPPPLPASALARALVVEAPAGAIDPDRLGVAQARALAGC